MVGELKESSFPLPPPNINVQMNADRVSQSPVYCKYISCTVTHKHWKDGDQKVCPCRAEQCDEMNMLLCGWGEVMGCLRITDWLET